MKHPLKTPSALLLALALVGSGLQAQAQSTAPATPTSAANSTTSTAPEVQQFTLGNGMTLIVKPDHRAPTAVHMLWVRAGSIDEVDGTSGVAHALEHMMFKGTPTLKPGEFSRRVAALGGRENAFTSRDHTAYYQQIPAKRLADVMALESDRFAHNQWSDAEFAKEIEVVKEERRMRTDDAPRALLSELLNAQAFVASPYHRPVIGWMGDLDSLKADDVRAFHHRWYSPANAAVVVVGDVDVAEVRRLAQKYYGGIAAQPLPERKPRTEPAQHGLRQTELKAPAEQAYVALAFRAPGMQKFDASSDDALALTVLAAVLDGYSGARLERALTQGEQRVADSAGAGNGLIGRGPQLFVLDGVPAKGHTPEEVMAALRAQVKRVADEGVDAAELQRVKTQWVASEIYKRDSVMSQAQELGSDWIQGLPLDAPDRLVERLRAVTAAQVQSVAQRYFGDGQLTVAILRPQPLGDKKPRTVDSSAPLR